MDQQAVQMIKLAKRFLFICTALLACARTTFAFAQSRLKNDPWLQEYVRTHPLAEPSSHVNDYSQLRSLLALLFIFGAGIIAVFYLAKVFKTFWVKLPENIRRGLLRFYIAISASWIAWFGYRLFEALQRHNDGLASSAFWSLLIVPIGAPMLLIATLWVIAGFRKAPSTQDDPPMPWGQPPKEWTLAGPTLDAAARAKHYCAIIDRAVSQLENKDRQARTALYAKARTILAGKLQGQGLWKRWRERNALDKAIRDVETRKSKEDRTNQQYTPASTASLLFSIFVFPVLWIIDATSMSLYWVARLRKPSK